MCKHLPKSEFSPPVRWPLRSIRKWPSWPPPSFSLQGERKLGGNKALYLFTLKVPELSLVHHSGQIAKGVVGKFRKNVLYNTKKPKERFHFAKHDGIEMWTYFGIPKGSSSL